MAQKVNDVIEQPFELSNVNLAASKAEIALFSNEIRTPMKARDFAILDEKAAKFRETKGRFIGGGWKIHSFYAVVSRPLGQQNEAAWKTHIDFLKSWKKANPQSIAAQCALVNAYISFAWLARGNGYADTVSEAAWTSFHDRIDLALAEIKTITAPERDPYGYFENMLIIAKAQDWGRQWYEKAFSEAVAYDPTYQYFYCEKAVNLLPRWGGMPGDWEQFAEHTKNSLGGEEGLKMYYHIAAEIHYYHTGKFFEENRVSWTEIKKGFQIVEAQYGMTVYRLNEFGAMTFSARDPQAACKTFALLTSDDFDSVIWKDKEGFENRRKMAQMMCMMPRADNMVKDPTPLPPSPKPSPTSTDTFL